MKEIEQIILESIEAKLKPIKNFHEFDDWCKGRHRGFVYFTDRAVDEIRVMIERERTSREHINILYEEIKELKKQLEK